MGKIAEATFSGASGRKYKFIVYSVETPFNNIEAVYTFTKRTADKDGRGTHKFLYIGETGELGDRIANHEKWSCVQQRGVNCICVHEDSDKSSRLRKEDDLLQGNNTPCND